MLSSTHLPSIQFSLDLTLIQRIKPCVYDRDGTAFHFLKTSKLYYSLVSKEIYTLWEECKPSYQPSAPTPTEVEGKGLQL